MDRGKFNILIGAMAGSESKGKISAWLTERYNPDLIVSHLMPNAGHTVRIDGHKFVSYHLPVCAVVSDAPIIIGPGAAINPRNFFTELVSLNINPDRLIISDRVPIITDEHIVRESRELLHNASTTQGCGACISDKIMRGPNVQFVKDHLDFKDLQICSNIGSLINQYLDSGQIVFCEMAQGFDLCINHGIEYPYCTSRNIQPAQAMADSGVSPKLVGKIYGVMRPYPIRVGNFKGYSGDYAGMPELTWEEIKRRCGAPDEIDITEITTTTKRVRRVFEFSLARFNDFMTLVRPDFIVINFANYLNWNDYGKTEYDDLSIETKSFVEEIESFGVKVSLIGTGPEHSHIVFRQIEGFE